MGVEFIDVDVEAFKEKVLPLHESMLQEMRRSAISMTIFRLPMKSKRRTVGWRPCTK